MLAATFLLGKTLWSARAPSTLSVFRAETVLEENRKQCSKCVLVLSIAWTSNQGGTCMLRPHTRNARWHPINSVKAKSPRALSPLVSVCVWGRGHLCSLKSFSNWSRVPEDSIWPQEHCPLIVPLLSTMYLLIKLDILSCFFLFQVWPNLVCCWFVPPFPGSWSSWSLCHRTQRSPALCSRS